MTESRLERDFVNFLISEKGYSQKSLLLEGPIAKIGTRRYIVDIVVLDTDYNNYLAIVELKGNYKQSLNSQLLQVKTYLEIIGKPDLPAYLVLPKNNTEKPEFIIYLLENDNWREIDKADFPHYETLSSKNQADEKKEFKDIDGAKQKVQKSRKELITDTAWSTLASLLAGVVATFIISEQIFFGRSTAIDQNIVTSRRRDSIQRSTNYRIEKLEKVLLEIKTNDSLAEANANNIQLSNLDSRVNNVENIINQSPERLMKMQDLTFQFQSLKSSIEAGKELSDTKLENLKERIDQLTLWTSGLIITIIGSIIGFAVNAFRKS